MLQLGRMQERIVATRELPARAARMAPIPADLDPALRACLHDRGLDELYVHQADMFERARRGEHVVITTATASGKSLGFLLPVLQAVVDDPSARVLMLYPTKALAHDQLRGVQALADGLRAGPGGGRALEMGVYDGDTPPNERKRLRERANLVLTNPDMLNSGLLPAHGRAGYSHLFRNVRYVIIDELHVYRGAFGAHVSNLLRRLLRICRHYGSDPQFLASSATIANPGELAERLCHRPFAVVDDDGSPSPGKTVHFWQPPLERDGTRRGVVSELTHLVPHLIRTRQKTIAFLRSRKETEVVLKEARDHLRAVDGDHDEADLLAAYRGGYTPEERRRIERDLVDGRLLGVVSTNALELGVDIGQLEVVVQGGFPGTRASFWQQLGRAGRRGAKAHGIVVLAARPTDQFIARDPDWLVAQSAEHAVVDPDNLTVQLAHIRAAAAELPLTLDDVSWFPDLGEVLPVLAEASEVREVYGTWHWCGPAFPAGEFSLRSTDGDRFKVVDRDSQRVLTEMTRPQVYREAHTRAVYLHGGEEYLVEELDLMGHRAVVVPVEQNFYTQPDVRTHIEVLIAQETTSLGRTQGWFGDVRVEDTVVGYKMLEFHNHQNLGYERLHQELTTTLETEAIWVPVPDDVLAVLGERRLDALRGMIHAVRASARLKTMAERSDLLGTSFSFTDPVSGDGCTALVCYDHHPGGIGFAAKAFDHLEEVLRRALALVRDCTCRDGCPACVGNYHLPRRLIAWGLSNLFERSAPPADLCLSPAAPAPPLAPPSEPPVPWDQAGERWAEVRERALRDGLPGSYALQQVVSARTVQAGLALRVRSPGLARWLGQEGPQRQLRAALGRHLALPEWFESAWTLSAEVDPDDRASADRTRFKLRRRFEDLTGDAAATERDANDKLASGFELGAER
jgi:DEAD/DEAH box helicase domain-containing protein